MQVQTQIADIMGLEGKRREQMCSRNVGPTLRWQTALGRPGSCSPKLSAITVAWRTTAVWMRDILLAFPANASKATTAKAKRCIWHVKYHDWSYLPAGVHGTAFRN